MGVASGYGEQEAGVASGSWWNLWVWLLCVVVRRYIDFLILLIPTPLVSVLFCSNIPTFCSLKQFFLLNRSATMRKPTVHDYLNSTQLCTRLSIATNMNNILEILFNKKTQGF